MKTILMMMVSFGNKVIHGNGAYRTPSFHRFNVLGGGAFIVSECQD